MSTSVNLRWALAASAIGLAGIPAAAGAPSRNPVADPPRLVSFFLEPSGTCPEGWKEAVYARGRLLMATVDSKRVGKLWGEPFLPAEPAKHRHFSRADTISAGKTSLKLWYDERGVRAVLYQQASAPDTWSDEATLGLPFQQIVACEREGGDEILDALPVDTVVFWNGASCPTRPPGFEWTPYSKADGRFVVPLVAAGSHEKTVNAPWTAGPGLPHRHWEETKTLAVRDVKGDGTDCWHCGSTDFHKQSTGLQVFSWGDENRDEKPVPYVELLACRKSGERRKNVRLHPLFTFFRATGECADLFRVPASGGRFLVGLPANATPNQAFGEPLQDGEDRKHTHAVPVVLKSQRVDVGKGTIARDIAEETGFQTQLQPSGPGLPYIQLAHCWSKTPHAQGEEQ